MLHLNRRGQSLLEALSVVVLVTLTASLMFHSGLRIAKQLLADQIETEKQLLNFSRLNSEGL